MSNELFPVPADHTRKLRELYPALQEVPEFTDSKLIDEELRFVILYGSPTSPIKGEDSVRIAKCIERAFKQGSLSAQEKALYAQGKFPDNVRSAILRMRKFNPSTRNKAKEATENVFNQFVQILNTDTNNTKITEMDSEGNSIESTRGMTLDELKKWSEMAIKITSELPTLIETMEKGFGMHQKIKSQEGGNQKNIDKILSEKITLDE
jgi:hypothetical protein